MHLLEEQVEEAAEAGDGEVDVGLLFQPRPRGYLHRARPLTAAEVARTDAEVVPRLHHPLYRAVHLGLRHGGVLHQVPELPVVRLLLLLLVADVVAAVFGDSCKVAGV